MAFLDLPGFLGGAYVVACVEDTSARELTKRDPFGYEGSRYVNPQPRVILEIANCPNRTSLEFELDSGLDVENSLHKVDVLASTLAEFRAGLVEEARLYREREPEAAQSERAAAVAKAPARDSAAIEAAVARTTVVAPCAPYLICLLMCAQTTRRVARAVDARCACWWLS